GREQASSWIECKVCYTRMPSTLAASHRSVRARREVCDIVVSEVAEAKSWHPCCGLIYTASIAYPILSPCGAHLAADSGLHIIRRSARHGFDHCEMIFFIACGRGRD